MIAGREKAEVIKKAVLTKDLLESELATTYY
jgi:hypothetical protein